MVKGVWIGLYLLVLVWSGIQPYDYATWALEVLPAVLGLIIVISTYKTFPLTTLLYGLILVHAIVLMIGGHYTYAQVPLGEWWKEWFGLERNNYDKLGHFLQGLVPAIIARELFIRHNVINGSCWRVLCIIAVCLGFSAFYELIEWWVALLSDEAAESFLGTQGYVWDTQSDMFYALIGCVLALVFLSKTHDKQLEKLDVEKIAS